MWRLRRVQAELVPGRILHVCRSTATAAATNADPPSASLQEVPGPRCYPLVGSLFDMIFDKDFDKKKIHLYFKSLSQKYGPVVRVKFPGQPILVMLHNPEDIQTIFQATMANPYREPMGSIRKIRYDSDYYEKKAGLIAENGEEWHRVSALLRPKVLRMDNIHHYLPKMDQVTLDFMERISSLRDSSGEITVDFKDELEKWSLECVCLVSLNQRIGCLEPSLKSGSEPELVIQAAKNLMTAVKECETGSKLWKIYPTKAYKQLQQSMDKLKEARWSLLSA